MVGPGTKGRGFRMLSGAGTSEELRSAASVFATEGRP